MDGSSSTVSLFSDKDEQDIKPVVNYTLETNAKKAINELFDPDFVNLKIKIPKKIERIFKNIESISFLYEMIGGDYIEIECLESHEIERRIGIFEYEKFNFNKESGMIFLYGRDAFEKRYRTEQKKKYKESVTKKIQYNVEDEAKMLRKRYQQYQVYYNINIVFIEGGDNLHSNLRSIARMSKEEKMYVRKTGKYDESTKKEFLANIIGLVPGISYEVSKAIIKTYGSLNELIEGLKDKERFMNMKIEDENSSPRKINERMYERICKLFYGEENERI